MRGRGRANKKRQHRKLFRKDGKRACGRTGKRKSFKLIPQFFEFGIHSFKFIQKSVKFWANSKHFIQDAGPELAGQLLGSPSPSSGFPDGAKILSRCLSNSLEGAALPGPPLF